MARRNQNFSPSYEQRRADQRQEHLWKQDMADHKQAEKIRSGIQEKVHTEQEKWRRELDNVVKAADRDAGDAVKRILSTPITRWTGGCRQQITVHHWRTPQNGAPFGPVLTLHGGRAQPVQNGHPALAEVLNEVKQRYRVLPRLTDNRWAGQFFRAAGLTSETTSTDSVDGGYGPVDYKVCTVHVPELTGVRISIDGLELRYAQRGGDSASAWQSKVPNLRAAFRAQGVDAGNLVVVEGKDGSTVLRFDDAPSAFPPAVATPVPSAIPRTREEVLRRYPDSVWALGIDARGQSIEFPMTKYPHALIVGGTGGGKSVWARSQLELLRAEYGFSLYLSDGKGSDMAALEGLPGVAWVAPNDDLAQLVLMLQTVMKEMDRRTAQAKIDKKQGRTAYNVQPILLLLDEWGSSAITLEQQFGKKGFEQISLMVDRLLRVGREARIHVALSSQTIRKTGAGSVPGTWQANLGLVVSLGNPEPSTIEYAFPAGASERAKVIGPRLEGHPGRGMYSDSERGTLSEFQSYYGWSPGTTRLDANAPGNVKPPTPEVRAAWEQWKPISDSVPWLAPRLGIAAESPSWRDDIDSILATRIVPLTDPNGAVKPGMEKYDPMDEGWLGAVSIDGSGAGVSLDGFSDDAPIHHTTPPVVTKPAPAPKPTNSATDDAARKEAVRQEALRMGILPSEEMTEDERKEAVRRKAIEMGLIPADDETADEPPSNDEPKPKPSTTRRTPKRS